MSRKIVALGRKLPEGKTTIITYAFANAFGPAWFPQPDPRADPDLKIDVDEIRKRRLEEHDPEDF